WQNRSRYRRRSERTHPPNTLPERFPLVPASSSTRMRMRKARALAGSVRGWSATNLATMTTGQRIEPCIPRCRYWRRIPCRSRCCRGVVEQMGVNSRCRVLIMYGRAGRNLRTERSIVVADKLPVLEPDPVAAARAALNLQSLQRSGTQLEWLYGKRSVTRNGADG